VAVGVFRSVCIHCKFLFKISVAQMEEPLRVVVGIGHILQDGYRVVGAIYFDPQFVVIVGFTTQI